MTKITAIIITLLIIAFGMLCCKSVDYKSLYVRPDTTKYGNIKSARDMDQLAEDLVAQMTLKEKIDQMYGEKKIRSAPKFIIGYLLQGRFPHVYVGENKRLNIPPWILSDGPRGARVMEKSVNAVTTFPVAMARGASWDIALEKKINEVIAVEMKANGVNCAATPCVNLLRHPGWGRAQETYGEDPWLLGEMGVAAVQGIQKHHVMACVKHFALYSIENSRYIVNVEVDERTLREVYLPHFKKIIQEGRPASVMSAYNMVRGVYCGTNKELLTDILRNDWGFEGFVCSDWVYGIYDGIEGVKVGLDIEMPWQNAYCFNTIKKGIEDGEITEIDIDKIVTRILKTRLQYAYAEDKKEYTSSPIAQPSHIELSREAAEKSMVLLKNDNILPFRKSNNKTIAVIGRLANVSNTGDRGSSNCTPPYVITPYEGIKQFNESLGNEVILYDGSDLASAQRIAKEADEVIAVVGFTYKDEGECTISREKMLRLAKAKKSVGRKEYGGDRETLRLHSDDEALIQAIAGTNNNLVVIYTGGSAIDMSHWEDKVPAILFAWYAGMEGGNALANILYGEVNPSGKLPFSIAENEDDYPDFDPFTKNVIYDYYHGYTMFDKKGIEVAYPFGFGLSYTDYTYANFIVHNPVMDKNGILYVTVDVKNTGNVAGAEIIQLYIGFKNSTIERPKKLLRGFTKIYFEAGKKQTVSFEVPAKELAWYNPDMKKWEIEEMEYEVYTGGSSSEDDLLEGKFRIVK